jgi:serine phosphatase RsbU (regulator of sigma subunit)
MSRAGIALADVSGHRVTDALLSLMLHQAFLLGAIYELDFFGEITTRLFENLNARFFKSSSVGKFLTLVYGEISEEGKFRFISAAHPLPVIFSSKFDRFVDICPQTLTTFPPIGTVPSSDDIDRSPARSPLGLKGRYEVNELNLMGSGDILLLYSDGLSEHSSSQGDYFPIHLEAILRQVKSLTAQQIFAAIVDDLLKFGQPQDDISLVVIKRN